MGLHNKTLLAGAGALAVAAAWLAAAPGAWADEPPIDGQQIVVIAHQLDAARESIKPSLGASTYTLTAATIANLPGGDSQPIQDILLQAPGVSQDQFGQFHVRDEHNGVQYRINGVIIPESISVFGQTLSPRLIEKVELVTGTLPAQYGLRTAGIVDITTRTGLADAASVGLYGGSHATLQPSIQLNGGGSGTTWFVTADGKHTDLGIDNVNGSARALHDVSNQVNLFGYVDHIFGPHDRVALTAGYTNQHFQIPDPVGEVGSQTDAAGQPVVVGGVTSYRSEDLNEQQLQVFGFGALSWLHSAGRFTIQTSVFARVANLDYRPDVVGEMLFNAQTQAAAKRDIALGAQSDAVFRLSTAHTLRAGALYSHDAAHSVTATTVFPTTGDVFDPTQPLLGWQQGTINGPAFTLSDTTDISQWTASAYVQDEWHPLPGVVINYGLRFDTNHGQRVEHQVSPRLNLVWIPVPGTTIHAGFARYFSPAPFELVAARDLVASFNTTAAPNVRQGDPPFAQRESYGDVGVEQKLGHWTVGLDGYLRRLTQLVDEGQFGAPIILTPFNYARGHIAGTELSVTYAHGGLSGYANLAWARAIGTGIDSNQYDFSASNLAYIASHWIYLDHNQTWSGSAGVTWRWLGGALEGTRISADAVLGSGLRTGAPAPAGTPYLETPNGAAVPSHAVANLGVAHKFARLGLDVRLDVVNVLDNIYRIRTGAGVGVGAPSYGARRGVFVGLTKTL